MPFSATALRLAAALAFVSAAAWGLQAPGADLLVLAARVAVGAVAAALLAGLARVVEDVYALRTAAEEPEPEEVEAEP